MCVFVCGVWVQWLLNNMSAWLSRTAFFRIPFPVDLCLGLAEEKFVRDSEVAVLPLKASVGCALLELKHILWVCCSPVGVGSIWVQSPPTLWDLVLQLLQNLGRVWEESGEKSLLLPISHAPFLPGHGAVTSGLMKAQNKEQMRLISQLHSCARSKLCIGVLYSVAFLGVWLLLLVPDWYTCINTSYICMDTWLYAYLCIHAYVYLCIYACMYICPTIYMN